MLRESAPETRQNRVSVRVTTAKVARATGTGQGLGGGQLVLSLNSLRLSPPS